MFLSFIKAIYLKAYLFWCVNIFSIIIIFFVLNQNIAGGLFTRLLAFFFCHIIGGLLGMFWSIKRNGDKIKWFRMSSGTLLMVVSLLMWSNNKYEGINIDCNGNEDIYNEGYTHGEIISYANDALNTSCKDYINQMAKEGVHLNESDCFCQGYYHGRSNRKNKYK